MGTEKRKRYVAAEWYIAAGGSRAEDTDGSWDIFKIESNLSCRLLKALGGLRFGELHFVLQTHKIAQFTVPRVQYYLTGEVRMINASAVVEQYRQ